MKITEILLKRERKPLKSGNTVPSRDINENEHIIKNAKKFRQLGFKTKDSIHIACAVFAKCDYFLTTDDRILSKSALVTEIKITDPIGFIREI